MLWDLKSKKADYRYTHHEVRHSPSICFLLEQISVIPATSALICRAAFFITLALFKFNHRCAAAEMITCAETLWNCADDLCRLCEKERGPAAFLQKRAALMCYLVTMTQSWALPEATFAANFCCNAWVHPLLLKRRGGASR